MAPEELEQIRGIVREEIGSVREETRAIVREELGSVREEIGAVRVELGSVREELGTMREELGTVREELGAVREELGSVRGETRVIVREEIAAAEQRILDRAAETARDLQTEILRGLEAFARGNFARFHSVESNQTDLNVRMAALEERVLYLETRRPQA